MKNSKPIYFLFIVLFCYLSGECQDYTYRHYDIKDGLAGNHVYHAVEDKDNFLWFATETGVSRFDGTSFKNFTTKDGLPNNDVFKLFADSKGRVWMMPFANQICYYYKGKIHNASNDSTLKKFDEIDNIINIIEDNEGNIYFFSNWAKFFVLRKNGKLLSYKNKDLPITSIGFGMNNNPILIGQTRDEKYLDSLGYVVRPTVLKFQIKLYEDSIELKIIDKKLFAAFDNITQIQSNGELILYAMKTNEVDKEMLYLKNKDEIEFVKKINNRINSISNFGDSFFNLNTTRGTTIVNLKNNSYHSQFLTNENVSYSFIDHEHSNWFLTYDHGIYRLASNGIKNVISRLEKDENVYSVISKDSIVYFATKKGDLYSYVYKDDLYDVKKINGLFNHEIIKQFKFIDDKLYFLKDHSLNVLDHDVVNSISLPLLFNGLSLKDYCFGKNGDLFFASHKGLIKVSLIDDKMLFNLFPNRVTAFEHTDSGFYLGTLAGLRFFKFNNVVIDFSTKNPLLGAAVIKLFYNKNLIWVGTSNSGLLCFDGNKIIKVIDTKSGLNDNAITCIYANGNFLWAGTNSGLAKIDLTTKNVLKTYSESDGILGNKINDVYSDGNKIFVATESGLFILDEKKIDDFSLCTMIKPEVFISDSSVSQDLQNYYLKPNESIEFKYTAISFKSEGKIDYYYRLLGLDTTWYSTSNKFIKYPVLPHREFEFQIYAVNRFGVKSKMITIPFEVSKKLYEKTWFILSSIFLLFVLIGGYIKIRIASNKRKLELKFENDERNSNLEQAALKAQMNPHFIFNCLNSIQYFVIEKDVFNANKFIAIFSSLIRQTLENSGKKYITIAEEVHYLKTYIEVEQNRFKDKFVCEFNIAIDIDENNQCIPPMLLQPFIENSINHGLMHRSGSGGLITIELTVHKSNLICIITDNGVGRIIASKYNVQGFNRHQSKGISLTEKRINLINNSSSQSINYKIEDVFNIRNELAGTRVTLLLPLVFREFVD